MKKKTLAVSILSIAMCGSLIAGATYALFTSESETNVAINAGKVEVVATLQNLEAYSPTLIAADGSAILDDTNAATNADGNGVFVNGGTATLASPEITLTNMTPGDYATFQIKITNYSTVSTKYRTVLKVVDDNGLADGLAMTIAGEAYEGDTIYSNWEVLSIPAGEEEVIELNDCKIELPIGAGDEYQEKSCKFVCVVEAIQANAETSDSVAKITTEDDEVTYYTELDAAVAALTENDTLEIIRPGTYAPFTIDEANVTVKGIVGKDKSASTVIKNTATERLTVTGGETVGVTLDSLWVDSTTVQTTSNVLEAYNLCAISTTVNYEKPWDVGDDLTITNCHIVGNGEQRVTNTMSGNFTFTNNYVENVSGINHYESSGGVAHTYSGNTIAKVNGEMLIFSAYDKADFNVVISDNTLVNDGSFAQFTVSDLGDTAFASLVVTGNSGNICLFLNNFNKSVATPHTVENGAGVYTLYATTVAFENLTDEAIANYEIVKVGGVEHSWFNAPIALQESVWLCEGTYNVVEKETGSLVTAFEVTVPVAGKQQVVKMPKVETVGTAADLLKILDEGSKAGAGDTTIMISSDIDCSGTEWTPYNINGYQGAGVITINGQGHTISHLSAPLLAGGFAGASGVVINDLTIANSNIVSKNAQGSGAFIEVIDSMKTITLSNCHLLESTVTGSRTGGLIGWNSGYSNKNDGPAPTVVNVKDCSVVDCKIIGNGSVGGIVGHAGANDWTWNNITNCTVENTTLTANADAGDDYRVGAIVGTANVGHVVIENCTSKGNKIYQYNNGAEEAEKRPDGQSELYGRAVLGDTGSLTIREKDEDGSTVTIVEKGKYKSPEEVGATV